MALKHRLLWLVTALYIILLSALTCGQEESVTNAPTPAAQDLRTPTSAASPEETAARQLRIYREALLQGSTDVIRIDAAVSLLLLNDPAGQEILLTALRSEETAAARLAVCKALVKSRGLSQTISRQEFLEPLLLILQGKSVEQAQVAAEALLLYEYSTIEASLRKLIQDQELDEQIRIQAIDALQLRPEPQALRILIGLLDDSDPEVAKAAETSLQEAFGIPVGTSRQVWADILVELQQKSPEDIRRERLLRQETKLREVQAERDRWQKLFLGAIDRQFELADEAGQTKMIQEFMASELAAIRLWALEKIAKYPANGERLRAGLLLMLADSSREVRLQTAKVLTNMSALNPAEKLLERFKVEKDKDSEIALTMFEALGEACFFAYSPGSGIELTAEIKMETLKIASDYLGQEAADPVKKGAEVIRKILELNNLPEETSIGYLRLLYERYERSMDYPVLRAELLGVLAHLCGQGSMKTLACSMYEPLFAEAITDKSNAALRLSAAKGMVYVNKTRALEVFRSLQLNKDESLAVQQVVIEATGQVGDVQDLDWLITGLLSNVQGEASWLAVKNICQRQKPDFLVEWICALEMAPGVTAEQIREILEIAELKAEGENNFKMLLDVRARILAMYCEQKNWEQGSVFLTKFNYSEETFDFPENTKIGILNIYLYTNQADKAFHLFHSRLADSDLEQNSPWRAAVMTYLLDDTITPETKKMVLQKAELMEVQDRPQWLSFIEEAKRILNISGIHEETKEDLDLLVFQ